MLSSDQFGENHASMSSGWVEDFLIEFFLKGSSSGATELQTELEENVCVNGTDVVIPIEPRIMQDACESQQQQAECRGDASAEDEKMLEAWQAQYGQVVRTEGEAEACTPAISLWNWTTLVSKGKCKSKTSLRLRGQLAQTSSRLHHSLQHNNGFIRTSDVREVNLDLVKVSSGEIFRLRQPSLKYLSSVARYDSSNPTQDWNFPCINLSGLDESAQVLATAICNTSKIAAANSSIAKPFSPNWNHQRYQQFEERKMVSPAIPAGLRALSGRERALADERKRKYRDRAKERREQYGDGEEDFESGMHYTKQEPLYLDKDTNNAMEEKLKRPLIGRQILERMGWREGESIGKRKCGLVRPLDAAGNHGRAGVGWSASHD
ncbi:hypothetical protein GOP47_0000984 [Adiantum capillus-veneris]|uniref:G-patch domain-containing protein n=1 Tax=Adiantum capillus-veneris TaxID=13818 RepID=A0A9D4VEZ1_ADICA|nr:hypothetical protein GOP47_0000984 [Adiantum capillus-veneris]